MPTPDETCDTHLQRVSTRNCAEMVWNSLTILEQSRVGTFEAVLKLGTIGLWCKAKGQSCPKTAFIDILRMLGVPEIVMQSIMKSSRLSGDTTRPVWDRVARKLRFGEEVIRTVMSLSVAKNIVSILDEFQSRGWKERVPIPQALSSDVNLSNQIQKRFLDDKVNQAISTLNKGLRGIQFRRCNLEISWTVRADHPS